MTYDIRASFVRFSSNRKVGPIPVVTSESKTCPSACSLKGAGCFAEYGPMAWKWKAVDGKRKRKLNIKNWQGICDEIKNLPRNQIWRHNDAGDLPGDDNEINLTLLSQLVEANKGRNGFSYTHKPVGLPGQKIFEEKKTKHNFSYKLAKTNARAILAANVNGLAINLSADSFEEADEKYDLGIGPVVVVCGTDTPKHSKTPKGRHVIVCPAQHADITCDRCGLCAKNRKAIIGFIAHGPGTKKIDTRLGVVKQKGKKHLPVLHSA